MDKHYIIANLPTVCPERVTGYTYDNYLQELGGHLGIYKRVAYQEPPHLAMMMCAEDWTPGRKSWAAEVTCTRCGESWHTAWVGGPLKEIAIMVGEDGLHYPVHDLDDPDVGPYMVTLSGNDGILCPECGESISLIHASRIKSGSTRRIAMCSVETVGDYAALVYWLAYRHMDSDGCVYEEISPWYAFVLDECGRMACFMYRDDEWHLSRNREDPFFKCYTSGDAIYNRRRGGFVCEMVPDLTGTTGEKTGLGRYVREGGQHPLLYLRTWQKKPAIENLVVAGWSPLIESLFDKVTNYGQTDIPVANMPDINWQSAKPHEMLHMDKAAYRRLDKSQNDSRRREWYEGWRTYRSVGGQLDVCGYDQYWRKFTQYGMSTVLDMLPLVPGLDIPKIERYLQKQCLQPTEVRILADTWRMTTMLTGRDDLTQEERWPGHLQDKHDQLVALNLKEKGGGAGKYLAGFRRIRDKFGDLQWSDGDLDIILPRDNGELIREGEILRHCVGTYGEDHVTESQTIFFVRRHRRRERCYYTLSMNMRGEPKRVQLHGYGNEHHGERKQYSHSIPKKVLDFCDRWEREVVRPWYLGQLKEKKEGKSA